MEEPSYMMWRKTPLFVSLFFVLSLGHLFAQLDLTVDRVEVTQAIQDRDVSRGLDNIVRLVANKTTMVRMYVGFTGSDQPVPNVDGIIQVYQDGVEIDGSPIAPESIITAPVRTGAVTRVDPRSVNENATLNFILPPLVGSNVRVVATVNPNRTIVETDYSNNTMTVNALNFQCRRVPDIVYQPINYRPDSSYPDPNPPDPDLIQPGVGDVMVRAIYPIPDLNYRLADGEPLLWAQDINRSASSFQSQMATRRRMMSPMPDFLYSWFPGNPFSGNGQANPSGLVAFGNTDFARFQRTFAHELGHLFGRGHISNRLENVGFDVENQLGDLGLGRTRGTTFLDVMVAGRFTREAWVTIMNYNAFLDRAVLRCSDENNPNKGVAVSYGDYLFLTGIVNADGTGKLHPAYTLTGAQDYTEPSTDPTHWLVLQDPAGNELYRLPIDARMPEFDGDDDTSDTVSTDTAFSAVVPVFPNLGRVLLEQNGNVVDRMERRSEVPAVEWAPISSTLVGKNRLSWNTVNAESGAVTYSVQYSPDNGETWYPLAVNVTDTDLLVDSASMGKSNQGILRILATDGLNTTTVERAGLNVF